MASYVSVLGLGHKKVATSLATWYLEKLLKLQDTSLATQIALMEYSVRSTGRSELEY
jgi:hypothetical protein